jgi:alpha-tubulin suppressor-like RCC1 family protein
MVTQHHDESVRPRLYIAGASKGAVVAKVVTVWVFFSAEGHQDEGTVCKRQDQMPKLQQTCVKKPKDDIFGLRWQRRSSIMLSQRGKDYLIPIDLY